LLGKGAPESKGPSREQKFVDPENWGPPELPGSGWPLPVHTQINVTTTALKLCSEVKLFRTGAQL